MDDAPSRPRYCLNQDFQDSRPNPEHPPAARFRQSPSAAIDGLHLPPVTNGREWSQDSARGKCQQIALPRLDDCKVGLVSILFESGFTGLEDEQDWTSISGITESLCRQFLQSPWFRRRGTEGWFGGGLGCCLLGNEGWLRGYKTYIWNASMSARHGTQSGGSIGGRRGFGFPPARE